MSAAPGQSYRVEIAPSGALLMVRGQSAVPKGYRRFGVEWLISLPPQLDNRGWTQKGGNLVLPESDEASVFRNQLNEFWQGALAAAIPGVSDVIPLSDAGLKNRVGLTSGVEDGTDYQTQLMKDQQLRAGLRRPRPDMPPFADMFLRQIEVLTLPSQTRVDLSAVDARHWQLVFAESAPIEQLLSGLTWSQATGSQDQWLARPALSQSRQEQRPHLLLRRATQLARLAVASGLPADATLRLVVGTAGVGTSWLELVVRPADRGLNLTLLLKQTRRSFTLPALAVPAFETYACGPRVLSPAQASGFVKGLTTEPARGPAYAPRQAQPLLWHGGEAAPELRFTFCGAHQTSVAWPEGLPFARTEPPLPQPPGVNGRQRRVFAAVYGAEAAAYKAWLAGPRDEIGLRHSFAEAYFAGIEFRMLTGNCPKDEQALLLAELDRFSRLSVAKDAVGPAIMALRDWLGAIGHRPLNPLSGEGPLTRLAELGRKVRKGVPLDRQMLLWLRLPLLDAGLLTPDSRDVPLRMPEDPPDPVRLPLRIQPPSRALTVSYSSFCGLCDVGRQVISAPDGPTPDLRFSVTLQRVLALPLPTAGAEEQP